MSARASVNAHTHLYSGLAPLGLPAPDPPPRNFVEILERVWWRLDRALDEDILRAAARYHLNEAVLHGTSHLVDHHESPSLIEGSLEILADACEEIGVGAVLCYGATERNRGREEAEAGLGECRRFLQENDRPHVRGVVGLHASFTVGDDTLMEAAELCREFSTVLHVHLAEDLSDVEDARRRGWNGPLERLLHFDCLPPGSILAHGVHLDASQVEECALRGLWLVQNPRSNENNRVGYPSALAQSSRVALGTDGFPSDMGDEEAALLRLGIEHQEDPANLRQRKEAGHRLIAERFADDVSALDAADWERRRRQAQRRREEIEEEARVQASRLWARMDSAGDAV